jgi:hypothetical protein
MSILRMGWLLPGKKDRVLYGGRGRVVSMLLGMG